MSNSSQISRGRLVGCNALVTGAARGIGEAIVRRFVQEGASVWLADIDTVAGESIAATLRQAGHEGRFHQLDVSDESGWSALVQTIIRVDGGLDILVNNAGIAPVSSLENTSLEAFRHVFRINTESVFLGMRSSLPALRLRSARRPGGSAIVNLSSLLAWRALPDNIAYGASKAAVLQLGRCAAIEFARAGEAIRVNSVLPAVTDTPMVTLEVEEWARKGTMGTHDVASTRQALNQRIPMGRIGQPKDIAEAVLFLASSESAFMTGVDMPVDGGRSAV